jgi:hypothetical protein
VIHGKLRRHKVLHILVHHFTHRQLKQLAGGLVQVVDRSLGVDDKGGLQQSIKDLEVGGGFNLCVHVLAVAEH